MNTPISKELSEQIDREAEALKRKMPDNYFPTNYKYYEGYIAGATAYAHYKERWEQAKKALEDVLNAPSPKQGQDSDNIILGIKLIASKALASWKEEGKEVGV